MTSASRRLELNEITIANPTCGCYIGVDGHSPVTYNRSSNTFTILLDRLTATQLQEGKITLSVKTKEDPWRKGSYENETWETLTLDISLLPHVFARKTEELLQREVIPIDPTDDVRSLLIQKYQKVFDEYVQKYRAIQSFVRLVPPNEAIPRVESQFAMFYEDNGLPKDMTLRCCSEETEAERGLDEGEGVKVHKFVLIANSPVFNTLLESGFKEGSSNTIEFGDVGLATLEKFVKYLYTRAELPGDDRESWDLYKLADRYQIDHLKTICKPGFCREIVARSNPNLLVQPAEFVEMLGKTEADEMMLQYLQIAGRISALHNMIQANSAHLMRRA